MLKNAKLDWGIDKYPGARKLNARLKSAPESETPFIVTLFVVPFP